VLRTSRPQRRNRASRAGPVPVGNLLGSAGKIVLICYELDDA